MAEKSEDKRIKDAAYAAARKRLDQLAEAAAKRRQRGERIEAWLAEKWGNARRCPYCEVSEWSFDSEPRAVPLAQDRSKAIWAYGVRCENCGNLVLLSAEILGLESDEDV